MQFGYYADECNKLFRFTFFLLLKMFDVCQTMPGEVLLHTSPCHLGLAWASPGSPRGCSRAAPAPGDAGTLTAQGGRQEGRDPCPLWPLQRGASPRLVHAL